jgi:hypothetical protein
LCPAHRKIYAWLLDHISAKEEYKLYRNAWTDFILKREELAGVEIKRFLPTREEGLVLLKSKIGGWEDGIIDGYPLCGNDSGIGTGLK